MSTNELRALADALLPMAAAPCFDGIDVERAADYLRAQADAQPVAWMYEHDGCVDTPLFTVNRWTKCEEPWNESPLFLHPAPAAPQAEPKRDWSAIDAAIREYLDGYEQIGENDAGADACYTPTERELYLIYDAINGLLADESFVAAISAPRAEPKREPLSDERITKGEYVLATKWSDGDPGDHWGVGFYDRFENGRHYVVDRAGQQIRGNGFRRVGRITADVGRWLLSAAESLEASPPGTVNLWTMLTERAHGIGGSDAE